MCLWYITGEIRMNKKKNMLLLIAIACMSICSLTSCEKTCTCNEFGTVGTVNPKAYGAKNCSELTSIASAANGEYTYCY